MRSRTEVALRCRARARHGARVRARGPHLLAVVDPGSRRTEAKGITEQESAAAADLQQTIAWPELERLENRTAREIVDGIAAVDLPRPATGGPPRDTVGQPVLEGFGGKPALLPRSQILIAQAESAQDLGGGRWPRTHGRDKCLVGAMELHPPWRAGSGASSSSRAGPKPARRRAPPSEALEASTKPPCASAACCTMARPSPDPDMPLAAGAR